jgi:polysaccharide export outer membrane protein
MNPLSEIRSQKSEVRGQKSEVRSQRSNFCLLFAVFCLLFFAGCGNKFFDPTQIGRFRPVPAVNVILDSLGVAEETPSAWQGAEEPRPIDVMVFESDYVFGSGDIVRISIFELLAEGVPFERDYIVTETGKISIPDVGVVEAMGLTESQLEGEIRHILSPNILKEPSVTVTLLSSQQRTFSIWGDGVPRPSRYEIPRYNFRLTDALATAGGARQFNVSYIYVSRSVTGKEAISEPVEPEIGKPEEPEHLIEPEEEMLEIIAPRVERRRFPLPTFVGTGLPLQKQGRGLVIASAEMITDKELIEAALPGGFKPSAGDEWGGTDAEEMLETSTEPAGRGTINEPINEVDEGRIEWIFQDGKWVPVQVGRPRPTEPVVKVEPEKRAEPLRERVPEDFGWDEIGTGGVQTRLIKIPVDKLSSGDARYNIVIRPGDSIQVPVDLVGEFLVEGNVNFQGFIDITGRPITLKMAIAAAGGLGPLAWPKRCEVIRRLGKNKEEIVMLDLDKIARGEQPDFFIKPNDLINVGTHPTSTWRAVLRNAFRATYGFGFIYDRNFADRDFGTRRPIPHWF